VIKIIGNSEVMAQISIATKAAVEQNKALPHMLLAGAAGCGKTSTAKYIASVTGASFISCAYDSIKKRSDLFSIIKRLDETGYANTKKVGTTKPSILFIDEIHGLSVSAQEFLGIMMEEWTLPVDLKDVRGTAGHLKNPGVKDFSLWLPEFTLIGATTNDGLLTKPFQTRFKLRLTFSTYSIDDSFTIVYTHANRLNIKIETNAIMEIAKRGRGVGRVLVNLLESCRDFAIYSDTPVVTEELVKVNFQELGIDSNGFTRTDLRLLKVLHDIDSPVGVDNIAVSLNESPKVLVENVEPYLIRTGLMMRTSRGRVITDAGRRYLMSKGLIEVTELGMHVIPRNLYQNGGAQ